MAPPLRTVADNKQLWVGLERWYLDMVVTDHCPFKPSAQGYFGQICDTVFKNHQINMGIREFAPPHHFFSKIKLLPCQGIGFAFSPRWKVASEIIGILWFIKAIGVIAWAWACFFPGPYNNVFKSFFLKYNMLGLTDLSAQLGMNIYLLAIIMIWSFAWKLSALWKSARRRSLFWFIVIALVNTVGILEILYIFWFSENSHLKMTRTKLKQEASVKKPAKKAKSKRK